MKKIIVKMLVISMIIVGVMSIDWSQLLASEPSLQESISQGIIEARANK